MGLDGVELVMAIEQKFGITISDEEAQNTVTVGDMKRLIRAKLQVASDATCRTQRAFHLIRRAAIVQFRVPRRNISPDTPLDDVIPRSDRQTSWRQFQLSLGVASLPELVRPLSISAFAILATLTTLVTGVWFAALHPPQFGSLALLAIIAGSAVGWMSARFTRAYKIQFSPGYARVRDVAQFLVGRYPELLGKSTPTSWSDEEIWCLLREIITEQLAVPNFDENSRFIEDLLVD